MEARLLNIKEVLAVAKCSRPTLYRWMARGKFPRPLKLNGDGNLRWRRQDIEEWQDKQESRQSVAYSAPVA